MDDSTGPWSYCGWALGFTLPFRTTTWPLSITPTIRSGCAAHVEAQVTNKRKHKVRKKNTQRRGTALRFGVADSIISSNTQLGYTGMCLLPGEGETDGPIIVEGKWAVNVIIQVPKAQPEKEIPWHRFPILNQKTSPHTYVIWVGSISTYRLGPWGCP